MRSCATGQRPSSMASTSSWLYNQEEKVECRVRIIKHAVESLTTKRPTSACVQRDDVGQFWKNLKRNEKVREYLSPQEIEDVSKEVEQWKLFSDSQIQTKKRSDLRVCYLCGNNPVNDLKVFVDEGVLCQNVWAIEKDEDALKEAWESIKDSDLRNVRMFKGDILDFLKDMEGQYDIIYYDSTGSLPSSRQKTCKVIGYVFLYNRLTSPGALITNFSFPPKLENSNPEEKRERERINLLTQEYLQNRLLNTTFTLHESKRSESITEFLKVRTDEEIYSDYITYQLIDSAFLMVPAFRMLYANDLSLWNQLFNCKDVFLGELKSYEKENSPLQRANNMRNQYNHCRSYVIKKSYVKKIGSGLSYLRQSNGLCKAWVKEIFPDWNSRLPREIKEYDIPILLLTHLLCTCSLFIQRFFKDTLKDKCFGPFFDYLYEKDGETSPYDSVCCLVGGLLYGQLAYPSFPVLSKLLRLQYTAKKRQMFCDVIIFDKCRYIYKQFPTGDCAQFALSEKKQRVVICMVVVFLRKHLEHVCQDVFHGCDFATLYPEMSGQPGGVSFPNIPQYSVGEREVIDRNLRRVLWPRRVIILFLIFSPFPLFFSKFFCLPFYLILLFLVFSFISFYCLIHV